jgi:hypothetical protein
MLQHITLNLARTKEHPEGSAAIGYEIVAPLDAAGRLDAQAWSARRKECRVRRFRPGEPDAYGMLVHRAGGAEGATWAIDYNPERADDDEAGYRLGSHGFSNGDYVSIRDEDGALLTFRVVAVRPARIAA